jgi:hypothetical protein
MWFGSHGEISGWVLGKQKSGRVCGAHMQIGKPQLRRQCVYRAANKSAMRENIFLVPAGKIKLGTGREEFEAGGSFKSVNRLARH